MPMCYGALPVFGAMPRKVFSHSQRLPGSGGGIARFDIIMSAEVRACIRADF